MERVHMRLTMPQGKKLMMGKVVQIKPAALKDDTHWLVLEKKTAGKVRRAKKAGRGCRIQLTPMEMEHSGAGIADFFRDAFNKVKEGAQWVKSNVIDTPTYQQYVKPIIRQGVNAALAAATPELGPGAVPATALVNKFGDYSGAYGLKEDFAKFGKKANNLYQTHAKKYVAPHLRKAVQSAEMALVNKAKKLAPKYAQDIDRLHEEYGEQAISELGRRTGAFGLRRGRGLQKDYSNFISPYNAAMHPIQLPAIGGWVYLPHMHGGSFKVAGY